MSELKDIDIEVMRLLAWDSTLGNSAIAERLGLKGDRVSRIISRLRKAELIEVKVKTTCPALWAEDQRPTSRRTVKLTAAGLKGSVPWQLAAKECLKTGVVTEKERQFLTDIADWPRKPTDHQLAWLDRLVDEILGAEAYR